MEGSYLFTKLNLDGDFFFLERQKKKNTTILSEDVLIKRDITMNEFSYSIEYLSQGCWLQLISCFEIAGPRWFLSWF